MTNFSKKPLIINVLTSLDFGGVESQMQLIAKSLNLSNFNHAFCAIGVGGSTQINLKKWSMQADALGCNIKIPSISAVFALWRYFKKYKPQVVHLRGAEANFHGAIAARLAGIPVVVAEEIGIPNHSAKAKRIFAWAYSYCDRIVAISQAVKDGVIAMNEAHASQIQVVYNPFSPQEFKPLSKRSDNLCLGFVGRLEPVKNPIVTVEAVALLREMGIKAELHIVGNGSLRLMLEQKIRELNLCTQVQLHGFQENPFAVLEKCHFYLQPSLTEGFGLAVCEAMSAGLPVIATARGGVPEIIEHDKTGWLIQEPTAKSLAEMIQFANRYNDDELQSIAIKGRDEVLQRFGIETYLNQLDELYNKLLKAKGR